MRERIVEDFTFNYKPNEKQAEAFATVRANHKELALLINDLIPSTREGSLALTKLQESMMWANAGISKHGELFEDEEDTEESN